MTQGFPMEPPRALRERSDLSHGTQDTVPTAWVMVRRRGPGMVCAWGGWGPRSRRAPVGRVWEAGTVTDAPTTGRSALSIARSAKPFRLGQAMSPGVTHVR